MTDRRQPSQPQRADRRGPLAPLPWSVRLLVLFVGTVLIAIGTAGLVLPGIQGILTIAVGLAVVSLASDRVHRQLRRLLSRWPSVQERVENFRHRAHRWLSSDGDDRDDGDDSSAP